MKVTFSDPLMIQEILGTDDWLIINRKYTVTWPTGEIVIPYKFRTDFASVPKAFHSIISPMEKDIRSIAVPHDWLYQTHNLPRSDSDDLLYWGMLSLDATWLKSWKAYLGVRVGGRGPWERGPTKRAAKARGLIGEQLGKIVVLNNSND